MDLHSKTPNAEEILAAIMKAERDDIKKNYYRLIQAMQAKMSQDQEPFI